MKINFAITWLAVALSISALAAEKKLWAKSYLGQKAPELIVEKWLTEEPETAGKWVLLDFWATWCGPCRKAVPELNAFHEKFKDRLVVIGVSDEAAAKVQSFDQPKLHYASAIDTKGRMSKVFEVSGVPHVVILDPQGIVRWEGFPFLDGHELNEKVIEDLLAGK